MLYEKKWPMIAFNSLLAEYKNVVISIEICCKYCNLNFVNN